MNLKEVEAALKKMQPRQKLFELIKAEMKQRGHWKGLPRGKPFTKS